MKPLILQSVASLCLILWAGCASSGPRASQGGTQTITAPSPEEIEFRKQRELYRQIAKAADAPTFGGSRVILDKVSPSEISDPELASFYAISRKIVLFCEEIGLPRHAEVRFGDIIKNLDYSYLFKRFKDAGLINAPQLAADLVSQAVRIKREIPIYQELASSLAARYAKGNP